MKLFEESRNGLCARERMVNIPSELSTFVALALLLLVALSAPAQVIAAADVVIRDRSGKLIERHYVKGNRTEIRGPSGNLLRVEIRRKDRIEIRAPNGKLLRVKKIQ